MRLARTHRIAITAHRPNFLPPTTLYGIIRPQDDRLARRHKSRHQQTQQEATPVERAPLHPIQHPMEIGEMRVVRPTHHPQDRRDRTFPRRQDRAHQQQLCMTPYPIRKQWRKDGNKAYYSIWHERLPPRVDLRMLESLNLTLDESSRLLFKN